MSEYLHVEKPFLAQLAALGWTVIDQGCGMIPSAPEPSLRTSFREVHLPEVFRAAVRGLNLNADGTPWLTDRQLDDLRDQWLRQPARSLLEINEAVQALLFKAQVDVNEVTGEAHPVVKLIELSLVLRLTLVTSSSATIVLNSEYETFVVWEFRRLG